MGLDIRLPNITATTDAGKLEQIRSYLYQFAEQLNWALKTFEAAERSGGIVVTTSNGTGAAVVKKVSTFNELKDKLEEYYGTRDLMILKENMEDFITRIRREENETR